MGELILCNQTLAALPYYIDEAGVSVYSIEELSYYIETNLYLLEADFMNEDLCIWIDKEMQLTETATKLREIYRGDGALFEFVACILNESGYLSQTQIQDIVATLKHMEYKSEFERIKIKADRCVENRRYVNAIYEYRKLLNMKSEANETMLGNVWHNLGCAYAGLFLFKEASVCYKRAYELNNNPKSIEECLYAHRCMQDEAGVAQTAKEFEIQEDVLSNIKKNLNVASRMESICMFEQDIDELFAKDKTQDIGEIVNKWKEAYRKDCRL